MKTKTDPRTEIKNLLENTTCGQHIELLEVTKGRHYYVKRKTDCGKIGEIYKEGTGADATWNLIAWKFELKGMEYVPMTNHDYMGYPMAWFPETYKTLTVEDTVFAWRTEARKAAKIAAARVTATELFNNLVKEA